VVALRSRRLETLLGASLDALTAAHLRGLVEVHLPEAFDLDFKKALYGSSDSEKRNLAVDVAAMANTAGGVILIGIDEDEQARAIAALGVEVSDAVRGRIRQVVAAHVSPVPTFDVELILDDSVATSGKSDRDAISELRPALGFVMIAVLRSPAAPHAVLVNESLRFPKRNGATTRYLSEPEVAAAYADRAAGTARLKDRIAEVEHDAFRRLDRENRAWVVVTLVPELPGDLAITAASFNEFQEKTVQTGPGLIVPAQISLNRVMVGRRRFLADGGAEDSPLARWASLELHADGAGAYGLYLPEFPGRRLLGPDPEQPMDQVVDDEWIVVAVLSGLIRLGRHARELTAASGNGVVRATLLPATTAASLEIGYSRDHGLPQSRSKISAHQDLVTAEAVATLDSLASPGRELITIAAALIDEIGQAFGIAEMGQLRRDGAIRRLYWNPYSWQAQIVAWAEQHEIEVTDEVLQT
jgi:hypothetical protein